MGAPDRTMLPERCLVLITEPLLSNPAVSVCAYFSMLVSILRMAREEFERGEIQYLAVLSPGIQCSGWIESSKLAVDALKPFLHEAERQAKECSQAVKGNDFRKPCQRRLSLSLSTRKGFKTKNGELDKSSHLAPIASMPETSSSERLMGSTLEHAQEAILSQDSPVTRMCSEIHSLGDSLPFSSSPPTYLDIVWVVPPQSASSSSLLHYSATDPRSLGLYGALRHFTMKMGGMGRCCITIAEVRVNGVSDTKTVMNPVWISWCSLLPARMVWLDASVQYLPLERNPAWRGRLLVGSGKGVKSLGNFSICTSGSKGPMSINPEGDFTLVRLLPWSIIVGSCHLLMEGPSASVFAGDMKARGCVERLRINGGGGLAAVVIMDECGLVMAWRFDEHMGCVVAQSFMSPDEICRKAAMCLLETREHDGKSYSGANVDMVLQAILSLPILGETEACHTIPTSDTSTAFSSTLTVDDMYNTGTPRQAEIGMYGIPGVGGLQSPEISCLSSSQCGFTEVSSHQVVDSGTLGEESSLDMVRTENAMKRTRSRTYHGSVAALLCPSSQVGGRSGSSLQRSTSLPHKIRSSLLRGAGKRKGGKAVP